LGVRLDDIPRSIPVDLIKVDVEGMELSVLLGAIKTIEADKPIIVCETTSTTHASVQDMLSKLHYKEVKRFSMYKDIYTSVFCPKI